MKTRYLAILATLAFLGFSVPAAAHECGGHKNQDHKHCVADPAPSGGGKAFLFKIAPGEVMKCGRATATGPSFGNVTFAGNVLFDPKFIHVHLKLQLKDVDPSTELGYPVLGNFDPEDLDDLFLSVMSCTTGLLDFPLCEGGNCTLGHVAITVKQNKGRTSGVLRLPGCEADRLTSVWVRVNVDIDGVPEVLRSTPVTIVLPPNEVGTGCPPI